MRKKKYTIPTTLTTDFFLELDRQSENLTPGLKLSKERCHVLLNNDKWSTPYANTEYGLVINARVVGIVAITMAACRKNGITSRTRKIWWAKTNTTQKCK